MAHTESGSDGENGEKPVRERLKQTTIAKGTGDGVVVLDESIDTEMGANPLVSIEAEPQSPGEAAHRRPGRKRSLEGSTDPSHDAIEGTPATPSSGGHLRKRYREVQEGAGEDPQVLDQPLKDAGSNESSDTGEPAENGVEDSAEMHTPPPVSKTDAPAQVLSPTKKRSRENIDTEDREQKIQATEETRARRSSEEERSVPQSEDAVSLTTDQRSAENGHVVASANVKSEKSTGKLLSSGTAFSNTSATSPFGTLGESKSPQAHSSTNEPSTGTSKSAFAASGFASMAGSASPFGATSSQNSQTSSPKSPQPSAFGSISGALGSGFASNTTTSFGAATSGFGSLGSGLGGFGSGLTIGFGGGKKLTSFAAPVGDTKLGQEAEAKPIGSSASDSEGLGSDDEGDDGDEARSATKEDESEAKFKIQEDRDTGEEGEETLFTRNARLFLFDSNQKQWKERGNGAIKVNVPKKDEPIDGKGDASEEQGEKEKPEENIDQPKKPRLLMRVVATHKLVLNTPIFKQMSIKQSGKQMSFVAPTDDGTMVPHLLRMAKESDMQLLAKAIQGLQDDM